MEVNGISPMSKIQLTSEQISELLDAHCYRVIQAMDEDTLVSYAVQQMKQSFDINPGQSDTDVCSLVQDILTEEDADEDAASEFIAGVLGNELADMLIQRLRDFLTKAGK